MAKFRISLNSEFARSADISFTAAAEKAKEMGYEYIEPGVHTGWGGLNEVNYDNQWSMEEDPLFMKEILDRVGLKVSGVDGHSPLMKPEAALPRLTNAIQLAHWLNAPFVQSDEMVKPDWMDHDFAHEMMRYTLTKTNFMLKRHKVYFGIEPHGIYTKTAEGLMKIVDLVPSEYIGVNWDTGNSFLAGLEDPYEGLERVRDKVVHVHAKDISMEQSEAERGKVTGTPVGCAIGDGVVDFERTFHILEPLDRTIVFSVECGTIEQAARSLEFLRETIGPERLAD
jgi:sugar phosphate isomerase/epimerase